MRIGFKTAATSEVTGRPSDSELIAPEASPRAGSEETGQTALQWIAVAVSVLFAASMILNNQMSGEAMWFWYATAFRHGAKLYSGLHTALQPFFVLEMAAWMSLFGSKLIVYEIPSLLEAFVLAVGFLLILRESEWPDWQKAILLLGSFVFTVVGHSYRFDDYHVVTEILIVYALWLLLRLRSSRLAAPGARDTSRCVALGGIAGLAFVTRVTDGAALIVSCGFCLFVLLRHHRLRNLAVFALCAAATALAVVVLTGDSVHAYLMSSIFRAAGSKGGTGSIFAAPLVVFFRTLAVLRGMKAIALGLVAVIAAGWLLVRAGRTSAQLVVLAQLCMAALVYVVSSHRIRAWYGEGMFYEFLVLLLTVVMYAALAVVFTRGWRSCKTGRAWDPRSVIVVLPILEWASYSAGAAAEPLTNYYAPVVLLLLLVPTLHPFRRFAAWANPSLISIFALVIFWGVATKVAKPYSWQNYAYPSMFHNRQWFHHPVYGWMYMDRDLLTFSERVCQDIGAPSEQAGPPLLSLPYPYPNYFCDTAPWHNYVQTFFDTATRATVEQMMRELQASPPAWIVYQRQLNIMMGAERLYNHGHPIAQRDLDRMIMHKLASGEWKLVDESSYLQPDWWHNSKETDWYIIRTR